MLLVTSVVWTKSRDPELNFDVIPYLAIAFQWSGDDAVTAHARTYEYLRREAPPKGFRGLTTQSRYRRALLKDPEALRTQHQFYASKPLYIALLVAALEIGLSPVRMSWMVSLVSYALTVFLIHFWLGRLAGMRLGLLLTLCFALSPPLVEAAGLSTPDCLSTLVVAGGLFLILETRLRVVALGLLLLAILIRPDNVLWCGLVVPWLWWRREIDGNRTARALAFVLAATAIYVAVAKLTGAASLGARLQHSFVGRLYQPDEMSQSISMTDYLRALIGGLQGKYSAHTTTAPIFACIGLLGVLAAAARDRSFAASRELQLLAVAWLNIVAHVLVHPEVIDRFFLVSYLLTLVATVRILANAREQRLAE